MLFKTIEDFKIVDKNTSFPRFSAFISSAEEQYILKVLGPDQLTALNAAYQASTMSPAQTNLLAKCQEALRNLTMYIALPKMNLRVGDLGVVTTASSDYTNASGAEIYFARIQYLLDGYRGLDNLFLFLEQNHGDYPLWTGSESFTQFKKYFVNTAAEFSRHVNINNSRWLLAQMLQNMDLVETLRIKGALGSEFFADLKASFMADDLSPEEEALLWGDNSTPGIAKAIALYTYSDSLVDPLIREIIRIAGAATADDLSNKGKDGNDYTLQYTALAARKENEADAVMVIMKKYLNAQASSTVFPLYFSSSLYVDPAKKTPGKFAGYNNDISDTSFVML